MDGAPYTTLQDWQTCQAVIDVPDISFIAEPPGIEGAMQKLPDSTKSGTPDWTNACLAALSSLACLVGLLGLRMLSFDKGFKQYSGVT